MTNMRDQIKALKKSQEILIKELESRDLLISKIKGYLGAENFQGIMIFLREQGENKK